MSDLDNIISLIIQATELTNPLTSVSADLETELRIKGDLAARIQAVHHIDTSDGREIEAEDSYLLVDKGHMYIRVRNHTVDGLPMLKLNVKIPLHPDYIDRPYYPDGQHIDIPQVAEFTWDISPASYETIQEKLPIATVVQGHRLSVNVPYRTADGLVGIDLAFDNIYTLDAKFTRLAGRYTEVSEEQSLRSIPFSAFQEFLRSRAIGGDYQNMLTFLDKHGSSPEIVRNNLRKAREGVRDFVMRLGLDDKLLITELYPDIQLARAAAAQSEQTTHQRTN